MKIHLASIYVDDQRKALQFYTEVLGFEKKADEPIGEDHAWLTVVTAGDASSTELLLEPDALPAAKAFKTALFEEGIPFTSFASDDVAAEHERLVAAGVKFVRAPVDIGPAVIAIFDDTCGNLIQLTTDKDL